LGPYLAGFIEGDGSIIIPKKINENPTIHFSFNKTEYEFALFLKKNLNTGSIQKDTDHAIRYTIRSKEGLLLIIKLTNGFFRTPKIKALHKLIEFINEKPSWVQAPITILPLDNSDLNSNSWLAGFAASDGNFYIRTTIKEKYSNITATFSLFQSRLDLILLDEYKPIMEKIASLLLSKVEHHKISTYDRTGKQLGWLTRNTNKAGGLAVVKYFTKYPLFTSKELDFSDWKKCLILINKKLHLKKGNNDGINLILEIKNNMNTKRTLFNWDHLKKFYT